MVIVYGALLSSDPGDIHQTIDHLVEDKIRVSVVGLSAQVAVCRELCRKTNGGDDSLSLSPQYHEIRVLTSASFIRCCHGRQTFPGITDRYNHTSGNAVNQDERVKLTHDGVSLANSGKITVSVLLVRLSSNSIYDVVVLYDSVLISHQSLETDKRRVSVFSVFY